MPTTETTINTTWKMDCDCGAKLGGMFGVTREELRAEFKTHKRKSRRDCVPVVIAITPEQRVALEISSAAHSVQYGEARVREQKQAMLDAVRQIAADLRRKAEDLERLVERDGVDLDDFSPMKFVERVQHDILWMVPNLGIDGLLGRVNDIRVNEAHLRATRDELADLRLRLGR